MTTSQSGGCLCGAVRYTLKDPQDHIDVCHCSMCRKFSGGIGLGLEVPLDGAVWQGEENIGVYKSSAWAERGFCKTCGSSLFYRMPPSDVSAKGMLSLCAGSLDDLNGLPLTTEIFIDNKPDSYTFAGDLKQITEQDVLAAFSTPESGEE